MMSEKNSKRYTPRFKFHVETRRLLNPGSDYDVRGEPN